MGVAPLPRLLGAPGRSCLLGERGEDSLGAVPAEVAEQLEGFVGEVDRVAPVDEDVVGHGGAHQRDECLGRGPRSSGGRKGTFGRVAVSRVDETPVPGCETFGRDGGSQWRERKAGRMAQGVAGNEAKPVDERKGTVLWRQRREHVGHRRQHAEPGTPTLLPVQQAEVGPFAHGRHGPLLGAEQLHEAEHRFGNDKGEALLEALREPAKVVPGGIVLAPQDHEDVGTVDLDVVCPHVVGEGVERPPRGEVEACVVPVAGQKAVLDGPPVERETHVRAAVVHGERLPVSPEHADRLGPDLAGQAALRLQLLDRTDPGPPGFLHALDHYAAPFALKPVTVSEAAAKTGSPLRSRARRAASTSLTSCGSRLASAAVAKLWRGTPATRTSATRARAGTGVHRAVLGFQLGQCRRLVGAGKVRREKLDCHCAGHAMEEIDVR